MANALKVTAHPAMGFPPFTFSVTAKIEGTLQGDWLCPEVVWELPDGTQNTNLEDCDDETEPPVSWTRHFRLWEPGEWDITVVLKHNKHVLARQTVTVRVLGH